MKNFTRFIVVALLALVSVEASAQHNGYNYGYQYSGYTVGGNTHMPHRVNIVIREYHRHQGFDWVGTSEFQRHHKRFFVITLRRGNRFIELTMNRRGEVIIRKKYAIDYRDTRPYRRGYADRKVIYHHSGYVYSRRNDRRQYDYPWEHDWKDRDEKNPGSGSSGKGRDQKQNDNH